MFEHINWLAVLVSTVIWFVLGAVWYAVLFGKAFESALAFTEDQKQKAQKNFARNLGIHFVSGFLISLMMAHLMTLFENPTAMDGIHIGFGIWLGFAVPLAWIMLVFEQRPGATFWVNIGNWLVGFVLIALVLAVWR